MLFLPAPLQASPFRIRFPQTFGNAASSFPFADFRLTPHYPAKSPLESVLLKVVPGADEYLSEKYAFEIAELLGEWSHALKVAPPALASLAKFLHPSLEASALVAAQESVQRSGKGIEVLRRRFARKSRPAASDFFTRWKTTCMRCRESRAPNLKSSGSSQPRVHRRRSISTFVTAWPASSRTRHASSAWAIG